jgi:hypothetical protein
MRVTPRLVAAVLCVGIGVVAVILVTGRVWDFRATHIYGPRTTDLYDPPVLAGQPLFHECSGGFYARRGDAVVLTSTGHCTAEGTVATDPDGTGVRGVFGPSARTATCDHPGKTCSASDMTYLVVAEDRIPWGRLNLIDFGAGGYREIAPGTEPLRCDDIAIGDAIEINGQGLFRTGAVAEKGSNDFPEDGHYFPCMIAASVHVNTGDSGGAVLVRGLPAGVASRSFGGALGFTPLAEGLEQLGLELCTTPDCDLPRP